MSKMIWAAQCPVSFQWEHRMQITFMAAKSQCERNLEVVPHWTVLVTTRRRWSGRQKCTSMRIVLSFSSQSESQLKSWKKYFDFKSGLQMKEMNGGGDAMYLNDDRDDVAFLTGSGSSKSWIISFTTESLHYLYQIEMSEFHHCWHLKGPTTYDKKYQYKLNAQSYKRPT